MLYQKPFILLFPDYVFVLSASRLHKAEALGNNSSIPCDLKVERFEEKLYS